MYIYLPAKFEVRSFSRSWDNRAVYAHTPYSPADLKLVTVDVEPAGMFSDHQSTMHSSFVVFRSSLKFQSPRSWCVGYGDVSNVLNCAVFLMTASCMCHPPPDDVDVDKCTIRSCETSQTTSLHFTASVTNVVVSLRAVLRHRMSVGTARLSSTLESRFR